MFSRKKERGEQGIETDKEDRMKEEQERTSDEGEEDKTGNQAQKKQRNGENEECEGATLERSILSTSRQVHLFTSSNKRRRSCQRGFLCIQTYGTRPF